MLSWQHFLVTASSDVNTLSLLNASNRVNYSTFFYLARDKQDRRKAAAEAKKREKEKLIHNAEETFVIPAEPGRAQPLPPTLKKSNKHVLVEFGMKVSLPTCSDLFRHEV